MRVCQKDVGCPGLIQTLRNALSRRREEHQVRMQIELRDGLSFIDEVVAIEGRPGNEVVILKDRQVEVTKIDALTPISA